MTRQPNIAIDGPAGSGKSTVARKVASMMGLIYVDTGAMYRAVTYLAVKSGLDLDNQRALVEFTRCLKFSLVRMIRDDTLQLWCNGKNVTPYLRHPDITSRVSRVAAVPGVRSHLVSCQRGFARAGGVVMEGRDIGTVVLPQADYKFFLTASIDVRLLRREQELVASGLVVDRQLLKQQMVLRDEMDRNREVGPLRVAPDARVIDCSEMTADEVACQIVDICGGGSACAV